MNINPVSFGRAVQVNAPLKVAKRAAKLINMNKPVAGSKDEKKVQQKLTVLFDDSLKGGKAQAVSVNGKSYILTGKESEKLSEIKLSKKESINLAKKYYSKTYMYETIKEDEKNLYNKRLESIISKSEEPYSIDFKYSKSKDKLKSINLIL